MIDRDVINVIRKIVSQETVYLRHYIGKVLKNKDVQRKGRVLVGIDELGLNKEDNGFWAAPRDKNSMSLPAKSDYVEIYFINGDRDRPVYMGVANEIKGMKAKNYNGLPSNHVLFEDTKNKHVDKFDEILNVRQMGKTLHKFAARLTDSVLGNAATDASYFGTYPAAWVAYKAAVSSALSTYTGAGGAGGGAPVIDAFILALGAATAAVLTPPLTMTAKINSASNQVKIGDK